MEVSVQVGSLPAVEADAIIVNLFQGVTQPGGATGAVDKALGGAISELISDGELRGKLNETALLHTRRAIPSPRVVVVGLGPAEEFCLDRVRQAAAAAARAARQAGARRIASIVHGAGAGGLQLADAAQATVEGTILGLYRYPAPGSLQDAEAARTVEALQLVEFDASKVQDIERGAHIGKAVAEGVCLARTLANQPANVLTPTALAEQAQRIAAECGMQCRVLDRDEMAELGMGALLSVARGSAQPPKLIVLEYAPAGHESEPPLVLVGKGITFDSGGLSLKPQDGMEQMRGDMSGAAAVLAALQVASAIALNRRVVGIMPATENMPGGQATRPGDVVTAMNGVSIEIVNTDAEGRLILADALVYAQRYQPAAVVDIATLTGGIAVALGHRMTGVFANDDRLWETIRAAGDAAGEPMWRMPLDDGYDEQIKTPFADIKNSGGRPASPITAARFLTKFVGQHPWAHLDIASTDWWEADPEHPKKPYYVRGITGVGVATLVGMLRTY